MSPPRPTYDELLAENAAWRQRVADLEAQLARLTAVWEQAQRTGQRQAAPCRQAANPGTPTARAGQPEHAHARSVVRDLSPG